MGKVEASGIWHSSHCVSDCTEMDGNDRGNVKGRISMEHLVSILSHRGMTGRGHAAFWTVSLDHPDVICQDRDT